MTAPVRPVVLWWGRSDPAYSRNAILRRAFADLGWCVADFRPAPGALAGLQARLAPPPAADLVWVPCFRQRDLPAARRFARRTRVPLCFDPLISAYDKRVEERRRLQAGSVQARRLLARERRLFGGADRVVADTDAHAGYFAEQLLVPRDRVHVIPLGAEEAAFTPAPVPPVRDTVEVLFYGSFLPLQGPDVIVQAAAQVQRADLRVTLLGDGPLRARCEALARSAPRVRFEPWLEQARLPGRIHAAHLLLGVFGTTPKAGRVIANKAYQALACGRGLVTRDAEAWPAPLRREPRPGLQLIPPGEPRVLARALEAACASPEALAEAGRDAADIYRRWFSAATVREALAGLLRSLGLPSGMG
jgi:glycosyltransferase involved in cell wall biosynthesis